MSFGFFEMKPNDGYYLLNPHLFLEKMAEELMISGTDLKKAARRLAQCYAQFDIKFTAWFTDSILGKYVENNKLDCTETADKNSGFTAGLKTYLVDFSGMISRIGGVVKASRAGNVVLSVVLVGHRFAWAMVVHPNLK